MANEEFFFKDLESFFLTKLRDPAVISLDGNPLTDVRLTTPSPELIEVKRPSISIALSGVTRALERFTQKEVRENDFDDFLVTTYPEPIPITLEYTFSVFTEKNLDDRSLLTQILLFLEANRIIITPTTQNYVIVSRDSSVLFADIGRLFNKSVVANFKTRLDLPASSIDDMIRERIIRVYEKDPPSNRALYDP